MAPTRCTAFHVAQLVDRILGGTVGRGVGELKVDQVCGRQPGTHRGGEHIDALVRTVAPHRLGAENGAAVGINEQL